MTKQRKSMRSRWMVICGAAVCWAGLGSAGMAAPEQAVITLPLSKIPVSVEGSITPEEYSDAVILGGGFEGWQATPRPQSPTVYLIQFIGNARNCIYDGITKTTWWWLHCLPDRQNARVTKEIQNENRLFCAR
jgi:hypothetical protein